MLVRLVKLALKVSLGYLALWGLLVMWEQLENEGPQDQPARRARQARRATKAWLDPPGPREVPGRPASQAPRVIRDPQARPERPARLVR